MSLKRQLAFKYRNLINSCRAIYLSSWLTSKTMRVIFVFLIVVVGSAYVIKITSSATSGFEMHKLEKQVEALDKDIQKIQIEIAESSALPSIQARLAGLNMAEASVINYISLKDTAVAKR
jgi:hypothetical protein